MSHAVATDIDGVKAFIKTCCTKGRCGIYPSELSYTPVAVDRTFDDHYYLKINSSRGQLICTLHRYSLAAKILYHAPHHSDYEKVSRLTLSRLPRMVNDFIREIETMERLGFKQDENGYKDKCLLFRLPLVGGGDMEISSRGDFDEITYHITVTTESPSNKYKYTVHKYCHSFLEALARFFGKDYRVEYTVHQLLYD